MRISIKAFVDNIPAYLRGDLSYKELHATAIRAEPAEFVGEVKNMEKKYAGQSLDALSRNAMQVIQELARDLLHAQARLKELDGQQECPYVTNCRGDFSALSGLVDESEARVKGLLDGQRSLGRDLRFTRYPDLVAGIDALGCYDIAMDGTRQEATPRYVLEVAAEQVRELEEDVKRHEARVKDLEQEAKRHESEVQDAYEEGLMQRDGPDELTEAQTAAWRRLEDLMHDNALGAVDGDVRILMHALTHLRDRLAVRGEKIQELEAKVRDLTPAPLEPVTLADHSVDLDELIERREAVEGLVPDRGESAVFVSLPLKSANEAVVEKYRSGLPAPSVGKVTDWVPPTIDRGVVTRVDQRRGLVTIKLKNHPWEEVECHLAAFYAWEEARLPVVGDHVDVYSRGGQVVATKLSRPPKGSTAAFVEQIREFADLSLKSPGLQGAVTSRLEAKRTEDDYINHTVEMGRLEAISGHVFNMIRAHGPISLDEVEACPPKGVSAPLARAAIQHLVKLGKVTIRGQRILEVAK
jgi:hypothetical protein